MSKTKLAVAVTAALTGISFAAPSSAGIMLYQNGSKYVKMGGRIHMQHHSTDPDGGTKTDEQFFRRARTYIEASLHPEWSGKFQFDIGKAEDENELKIKDFYMKYKGFKYVTVKAGNATFPFSREQITSSKKQQLVERTFVGDHNYGVPDRNLGVHLSGKTPGKKVVWGVSYASSSIDPSSSRIDFDTPVNKNSDFNEGWIFGGRIEFHPIGHVKMAQSDLGKKAKSNIAIGLGHYSWSNDDDNNGSGNSLDKVTGTEVSFSYRGYGFSADIQANKIEADTVNPVLTSGLYVNGKTELDSTSVELGYMVIKNKLEITAGTSKMDADGFATEWKRKEFGAQWFIKKQDIKVGLTIRDNENVNGVAGSDSKEVFLQAFYTF